MKPFYSSTVDTEVLTLKYCYVITKPYKGIIVTQPKYPAYNRFDWKTWNCYVKLKGRCVRPLTPSKRHFTGQMASALPTAVAGTHHRVP